MANMTIENLNHLVQTGDVEKIFSGGAASEFRGPQALPSDDGKSFSEILKDSVDKVNLYQSQADTAIKELVAGRTKNIHETMLTIERADTSLKMMMQVRNKILDAYKEIMRMQI